MPSLTPLARLRARRYSDNQPRDDHGRWTSGGGGDSSSGGGGGSVAAAATASGFKPQPFQVTSPGAGSDEAAKQQADLTAFAQDHFHTQGISPSESDALRSYEGTDYKYINSGLRDGRVPPGVNRLDSAIEKSTVDTNTVVYRGLGTTAWPQLQQAANGGTFTDSGFVSTSLNANVGMKFSANTMEIDVPAGSHALSMVASGVNPADTMQEAEVVLPRGATFQVGSVDPVLGIAHATYMGTSSGLPGSVGKLTRSQKPPAEHADKFTWEADDIVVKPVSKRSLAPLARLRGRRYSDNQPRDDHGRWTSGGGDGGSISDIGGGGGGSVAPITAAELAGTGPGATSGPGASRPVSQAEFNQLASEGQARLDALSASSPTTGLNQNFDSIKSDAYQQVQQSWGGATYDAHTGEAITGNETKYALTVGGSHNTVTIPENASQADFNAAMDTAKANFGSELAQEQRSLGVFHNDDAGTIEIDPVLVVDNLHDVETIGAATHAVGGAYNFADGNGYWPPHVAETAAKAA